MQEHATIDAHDACLGLCWNVPQLVDPHDVFGSHDGTDAHDACLFAFTPTTKA